MFRKLFYIILTFNVQQSLGSEFRDIYKPDPENNTRGITYENLQDVLQDYPIERDNLDKGHVWWRGGGTEDECHKIIGYREKVHFDSIYIDQWTKTKSGEHYDVKHFKTEKNKPCRSILHRCRVEREITEKMREGAIERNRRLSKASVENGEFRKILSEKKIFFCQSDLKTEHRRYDFWKAENHTVFGRNYDANQSCDYDRREKYPYSELYPNCICECEHDARDIDRYFSLLDVVADKKKVVTGARIKKFNHVFHIQIQQGLLGPNRTIVGKAKWKDVEAIPTSDLLSKNISEYTKPGGDDLLVFHKNPKVYAVTGTQRTILLDDLRGIPGELVTGLRFQQVDNNLTLAVQLTPVDYVTGFFDRDQSRWVHNKISNKQRKPINITTADDPSLYSRSDSAYVSSRDKYVEFTTSDFKKDLGQTTVPFLDVQDVVADRSVPLVGAGIFYKGNNDSAGFIALKLIGDKDLVDEKYQLAEPMLNQYRELWSNDPYLHTQGDTYEKLEEVFQSYPVDRRNMDQHSISDTFSDCKELIGYREKYHVDSIFNSIHTLQRLYNNKTKPCYSFLENCRVEPLIKANPNSEATFCSSNDKHRRYDNMRIAGKVYGPNQQSCDHKENYSPIPFKPCLCDCESEQKEVDRYFNLISSMADDKKVVTGIRFIKQHHIICIQIQQGILGPDGTIIGKPKWKDVQDVTKLFSIDSPAISRYIQAEDGTTSLLFHKHPMIYAVSSAQNTVLLDDLHAGPDELVTGVRFNQIGQDLRLEIYVTPFDRETGKLQTQGSHWVHNEFDKNLRKPVDIKVRDIPSLYTRTTVISGIDKYVKFQTSDFEKDLGQTTVPFIDLQDVVSARSLPLSGVGIIHKGNQESAGFLALKAMYNAVTAPLHYKN